MKILELEIHNIRGLPNIKVIPEGRNLLVWGPNGSGKSGVIDAIDFLLSGRITRLTGRGTGGISLSQHGPHIDSTPDEATVRARIILPGIEGAIDISRSVRNPDHLECPNEARPLMSHIEALARRGQHILTRRDILKFITAESSSRADEIQQLLDLSDVEELRRGLVTVVNRLRERSQRAQTDARTQEASLAAAVGLATYSGAEALRLVNEHRTTLGAASIVELHSLDVRAGVTPPSAAVPAGHFNAELARRDLARISEGLSPPRREELSQVHKEFADYLAAIRSDPYILHELKRLQLTESGVDLLDGSGQCPLCGTQWDAEELKKHLEEKGNRGRLARTYKENLDGKARQLHAIVTNMLASVREVANVARETGDQQAEQVLDEWGNMLSPLLDTLGRPMEAYSEQDYPAERAARLWAPESLEARLSGLAEAIELVPATPVGQTSWDLLTRVQDRLGDLESGRGRRARAERAVQRAEALAISFERSRDAVLTNLYASIRDRFVEFYKILHEHEPQFAASLQPDGAGLGFAVDFMGRGTHPPQALHSEGHQDSMGICLFLALAERLDAGILELIALDDVVMSVDADHRRHICRLLTAPFPNKQFVLTTHDQTWAMQLKASSVVERKDMIHFVNWAVETGPIVGQVQDLWERIAEALARGDVNDAALRLRRGCEQYFEMVCDALHAAVRYNSDHRWDLDDWLTAALVGYKTLLKQAKSAAQSWNDTGTFDTLTEQDSVRAQIYERCQIERWAVNPHIHYNNWADLTPEEFTTVVQAFHDLSLLFECAGCAQLIQVTETHGGEVAVKCACGQVNWNLEQRTTSSS